MEANKMKDIKQFIQITYDLSEPLRREFLQRIDEIEKKIVKKTKEEAIELVKIDCGCEDIYPKGLKSEEFLRGFLVGRVPTMRREIFQVISYDELHNWYHQVLLSKYTLSRTLSIKTKEEAIAFARKYLADRKDGTINADFRNKKDVWNIAVEYILLDIIPYLYGDALD